ncbi:MAG: hypothetical protein ABEJ65_04285 [bacterium]
MVIEYTDIFTRAASEIPRQDWYTENWKVHQEDDSLELFRANWKNENHGGIRFHTYGQGDDPEQSPIMLELKVGDDVDNREQKISDVEDRMVEVMKPLIGWEVINEGDVFMRKELPSDPLTLMPRLLEEFKKLEAIADEIDAMLSDRRTSDVS